VSFILTAGLEVRYNQFITQTITVFASFLVQANLLQIVRVLDFPCQKKKWKKL
jgi:hypothetical protein